MTGVNRLSNPDLEAPSINTDSRTNYNTMDGIVKSDDVMGGEPRLEGRRISVRQIAEFVLDGGKAPADAADQLGVSLSEVHLALAYHYANPDEMAAVRERHRESMRAAREQAIEPPEKQTR